MTQIFFFFLFFFFFINLCVLIVRTDSDAPKEPEELDDSTKDLTTKTAETVKPDDVILELNSVPEIKEETGEAKEPTENVKSEEECAKKEPDNEVKPGEKALSCDEDEVKSGFLERVPTPLAQTEKAEVGLSGGNFNHLAFEYEGHILTKD